MRSTGRGEVAAAAVLGAVLLGGAAGAGGEPTPDEALPARLDRYEARGRGLVQAADGEAPLAEIDARAGELIDIAELLLGEFAIRYPVCGPYLKAALGVLDRLPEIATPELERDFHADAALPAAPAFCYHAKDLLVHPAAVRVHVRERREDAHRRMVAEMREALAHVAAVRRLFSLAAGR